MTAQEAQDAETRHLEEHHTPSTMTFEKYIDRAQLTAVYPGVGKGGAAALSYIGLGLAGEAGEVADEIKKMLRDDEGWLTSERRAKLVLELGDVFWYLSRFMRELGLEPADVMEANLAKLAARVADGTIKAAHKRTHPLRVLAADVEEAAQEMFEAKHPELDWVQAAPEDRHVFVDQARDILEGLVSRGRQNGKALTKEELLASYPTLARAYGHNEWEGRSKGKSDLGVTVGPLPNGAAVDYYGGQAVRVNEKAAQQWTPDANGLRPATRKAVCGHRMWFKGRCAALECSNYAYAEAQEQPLATDQRAVVQWRDEGNVGMVAGTTASCGHRMWTRQKCAVMACENYAGKKLS